MGLPLAIRCDGCHTFIPEATEPSVAFGTEPMRLCHLCDSKFRSASVYVETKVVEAPVKKMGRPYGSKNKPK